MNLQAYEVEFLETASQIPNDLWEACFPPPAEGRWLFGLALLTGFVSDTSSGSRTLRRVRKPVKARAITKPWRILLLFAEPVE
jgi:hypothetical protein